MGAPLGQNRVSLHGTTEVSLDRNTGRFNLLSDWLSLNATKVNFTRDPLGRFLEIRRKDDYDAFARRMEAVAASMEPEAAEALLVDYVGFTIEALVDANLRLIIPKKMREYLGDTASIVLVGVGESIQIWPADVYNKGKAAREERLRTAFSQVQRQILIRDAQAVDAAAPGAA